MVDRDENPMDLPEYIKGNVLVKIALRKAKDKVEAGAEKITNKAWKDFIKRLDEI